MRWLRLGAKIATPPLWPVYIILWLEEPLDEEGAWPSIL